MKRFLIVAIVLLAGSGAFVGYKYLFQVRHISVWSLVPDNALLVYESADPAAAWVGWEASNMGQGLQAIDAFKHPGNFLTLLDSIFGGRDHISKWLSSSTFIASMHSTGSSSLDFLILMELTSLEGKNNADKVLEFFRAKKGGVVSTRTFQGFILSEIKTPNNEKAFTFIYDNGVFAGSFTPFLVEDAIRNIEKEELGFFSKNKELLTLSRLQNDHGNLYLNTDRLGRLVDTFVDERTLSLAALNTLGSSTFMDLKVTKQQMLMNGFTLLPANYTGYLSGLVNNPAQPSSIEQLISNRTAVFVTLSFKSAGQWNRQMAAYRKAYEPGVNEKRSETLKRYDIDINSFVDGIGGQAGVALLESSLGNKPDKVAYLEVKDVTESLKQFDNFSERINKTHGDTTYHEAYAGYTIKQLEIDEFPYQLLGKPFDGFGTFYYTGHQGCVIGAASVQALKAVIDDIASEETWGRSAHIHSFLENTLQEASLSLFVHTPQAWNLWQQSLDDPWKELFLKHSPVFQAIELLAVQCSYIDNKFYTSVVAQQTEKAAEKEQQKPLLADRSITFMNRLASRPYIVKNYTDLSLETLVQDSAAVLHLLSANQEVLWADSLKGFINSPVFQIDYYKNGKLQYLFSTPKHIYAIDRAGEYLPGFPVEFNKGGADIAWFNLIDYDKSKNYRYFIADVRGNLYITDKDANPLEGWRPKELSTPAASPPQHLRAVGRDFLIALQNNGIMQVFNRKGEPVSGFPFDLKSQVNNVVVAEAGSTTSNSKLTTITNDGSILQINLAGKVVQRDQLYRPSAQSKFGLVQEASGKGYIFTRQDANRLAIIDRAGTVLFEKDYLSSGKAGCQFYDFGGGQKLFVVNDPVQAFTYLFDAKGNLINFRPMETGSEIALLFSKSKGEYTIFKTFGKEFSTLSLQK